MMRCLGLCSGALILATTCSAFAPQSKIRQPWLVQTGSLDDTLRMSAVGDDETKELVVTNPSAAFGSPLTEKVESINKFTVGLIKNVVFDTIYADRDFARFYALETIARMPYFAYLSVLHFYETIGRWRKAEYLKIHFAEDWNELHHLLIMEELGGADRWFDRFVAQHVAVAYYWIVIFLYMYNPTWAYNINENVEEHAYLTYNKFLQENEEMLKKKPAPKVALDYYRDGDLYMFDEFQTDNCQIRRPEINNLYDVFVAIREDESEHMKTMQKLQTDVELSTVHDETCDVPEDLLVGTRAV